MLRECRADDCRIPEFLLSIEDPRLAIGGAIQGCPVCGGEFSEEIRCANRC